MRDSLRLKRLPKDGPRSKVSLPKIEGEQ